ncbi:MAG TPA: STAS domain-containing protein [Vicinamibacterales bacterium]|nr:STAS domain-containing protein [Vicinamibacterales bacterium]
MTLHDRTIGDVVVIDVSGRITIDDGADLFRDRVRGLLRDGRAKLILNFRDAPYIDSTALGEIVRSYTSATRKNGTVKLLSVTPRIHELLVVTKLLSVFDLFDDEIEAVRSFGAPRA